MTEKCKAFYDYESCSQEASVAVFGKLNTHLCLQHFARFHQEGFTDYKYFKMGDTDEEDKNKIYDFKEDAPWIKTIKMNQTKPDKNGPMEF